uniref:Uncharacterized protein n=1 Tax=Pyramimonas obovata TaxID=1411642 RepID=A0A7S0R9N8_9CHLO
MAAPPSVYVRAAVLSARERGWTAAAAAWEAMQAAGVPAPKEAELFAAVVKSYEALGQPNKARQVAAHWHELAAELPPATASAPPLAWTGACPEGEVKVV